MFTDIGHRLDIQKLLSLCADEKRLIAEPLWDSLLSEDENETITEEEKQLLQQRWNALQNGESKLHKDGSENKFGN